MSTGKTIALTRWTFVDKVMSLLFNMLSWLVIIFIPMSRRLLISWLQSPSAVILEPQKIKSATVSTSPSICHEVMGPDAMILVFWINAYIYIYMEKEMAAHSSILAWKIPWMEEPGGLQSMGSQRVRHDWVTSLSFYIYVCVCMCIYIYIYTHNRILLIHK